MTMVRVGLGLLLVATTACTVEGEDMMTTFADPTANPSGTPPGDESAGDNTEGSSGGSGGPSSDSAETTSAPSTTTATTSAEGSTGAPPVDEQPDNGMYSECAGVADCIGLNTCVLAGAVGFCSNTGCTDPVAQCDANPGATATAPPACVDNGAGQMVCALACAGGQSCPGGMECVALGGTSVCA